MNRLIGNWIRSGYEAFEGWRNISNSRRQADGYRKRIAASKPHPFVTDALINRAKEESNARFGDPGHWRWLVLYAELREEYVSGWLPGDLYTHRLIPYLNPRRLAYLSTFKSYDHRVFPEFAARPIGRVVNGCYYIECDEPVSKHKFFKVVKNCPGEVVVKEDGAASGSGVRFVIAEEIESYQFQTGKSYLIQPLFVQHPQLAQLYPDSINTLRISTYLGLDGRFTVKHKILRVGSGGRRIVNAGDKDIDLYLDETGKVTQGAIDGLGRFLGSHHPETDVNYQNVVVPSLTDAIGLCKKAHQQFPYLRFIAWDLYIDRNAVPRMIEWNAVNPSIWVHEARIGPLWSEEEIKEALIG